MTDADPLVRAEPQDLTLMDPCWFHRFGGGEPCQQTGVWSWPAQPDAPGRGLVQAMRWCGEHKHDTDRMGQ